MKDVGWEVTAADVLAAHVDAGETTNPSAVAARARKAATATDFIVLVVGLKFNDVAVEATYAKSA